MKAYRILRARIEAFLALPLAELKDDPQRLKAEMDKIGLIEAEMKNTTLKGEWV